MSGRPGRSGRTALAVVLACAAAQVSVVPAARGVTIRLINADGPGEGFNDPTAAAPVGGNSGTTIGAQRLIAFQRAVDVWAQLLDSRVEIRISARFDPLPCDDGSVTLGESGPVSVFRDFAGAPAPNTYYPSALADRLAGMDLEPDEDDIQAQFNSSFGTTCTFAAGWYYGLDGAPPGDDSDLVTVVLHELGHGMGFLSLVDVVTGVKGVDMDNRDDAFLKLLVDDRTGKTLPAMTNAERQSAIVATGHLKWDGDQVVAASGRLTTGADANGRVEMYAPPQPSEGSSVSHWSDALFPNELMEPFFTQPIHSVGLAAEAFADMGWNAPGPITGCQADCNGDGAVVINELITAVSIALGELPVSLCPPADPDRSGAVAVNELVGAVTRALEGCDPAMPSPTSTPSPEATPTTPPSSGCPWDFETSTGADVCLYQGRWNPDCGDDTLAAGFASEDELFAAVIATDPLIGVAGNVTSPTTAELVGWFKDFDTFSDFESLSGTATLGADGSTLRIDPDDAPFVIDECAFVDYQGAFTGTAESASSVTQVGAARLLPRLRQRLRR